MKIIAINGSPRKKWNTATLLENSLEGATAAYPGVETEIINLYDYHYHGCISCFECKRLGGPSYGKCAVKDDIKPLLERVVEADGVVFGSPIYFSDITGQLRCFMERLLFAHFVYDKDYSSLAPRKVHTAFVYTMNVPQALMEKMGYPDRLAVMENFAARIFGHKPKRLYACDTYQFKDYSKYASSAFDAEAKAKQRETQFPIDCQHARELGKTLCQD